MLAQGAGNLFLPSRQYKPCGAETAAGCEDALRARRHNQANDRLAGPAAPGGGPRRRRHASGPQPRDGAL